MVDLPSEKGHMGRKPAEPDAREVVGVSLFGLGGRKVELQSHGEQQSLLLDVSAPHLSC